MGYPIFFERFVKLRSANPRYRWYDGAPRVAMTDVL